MVSSSLFKFHGGVCSTTLAPLSFRCCRYREALCLIFLTSPKSDFPLRNFTRLSNPNDARTAESAAMYLLSSSSWGLVNWGIFRLSTRDFNTEIRGRTIDQGSGEAGPDEGATTGGFGKEAMRARALDSRRCFFRRGSATGRSSPVFADSLAGTPPCSRMLGPDLTRRRSSPILGMGGFRGRRASLILQPIS